MQPTTVVPTGIVSLLNGLHPEGVLILAVIYRQCTYNVQPLAIQRQAKQNRMLYASAPVFIIPDKTNASPFG